MQAGYKNKIHDIVAVLYAAERTLRRKSKMVDLLIAFGIGTVLGAFGVLLLSLIHI